MSAIPAPLPPTGAARTVPGSTNETDPLRRAALEFEAVFLSQMLQPMFAGLSTDGPFGGGHAEQTYRSMMLDEYGRSIPRAGGIGIADAVMREMLSVQEAASGNGTTANPPLTEQTTDQRR